MCIAGWLDFGGGGEFGLLRKLAVTAGTTEEIAKEMQSAEAW